MYMHTYLLVVVSMVLVSGTSGKDVPHEMGVMVDVGGRMLATSSIMVHVV